MEKKWVKEKLMVVSLAVEEMMRFWDELKDFVPKTYSKQKQKDTLTHTQKEKRKRKRSAVCSLCFSFNRFGVLAGSLSLLCVLPFLWLSERFLCLFCSVFCSSYFRIIIWMRTNRRKAALIFSINIFGGGQKTVLVYSFCVCMREKKSLSARLLFASLSGF